MTMRASRRGGWSLSRPAAPAAARLTDVAWPNAPVAEDRTLHLVRYDAEGRPLAVPPAWVSVAQQGLQALLDLPASWDDEGARQVTPVAVRRLVQVLSAVVAEDAVPPHFFPLPDGGVQAEWHADGAVVEIEVDAAGGTYVAATWPGKDSPVLDAEIEDGDVEPLQRLAAVLNEVTTRVALAR